MLDLKMMMMLLAFYSISDKKQVIKIILKYKHELKFYKNGNKNKTKIIWINLTNHDFSKCRDQE